MYMYQSMDTQWRRYEVFEQERAGVPHRNTGSVHAPDGEMALENARDVFVRRPNCFSLWVVPEDAVFARTRQELEDDSWGTSEGVIHDEANYLVFQKQGQTARETYVTHVGQVTANSAQAALARALETHSSENVFVWWVVPERAVIRSEASDAPSMFDPAHSKGYRNHLSYPVEPIMRELKSAQELLEQE